MKKAAGFTLIELLVVIAIIGILSAVVLASLSSSKMRANDAKRMSDLHQIQIALSLYYTQNGAYPIISAWATSEATTYDAGPKWTALQTALSPYIAKLPHDPNPTGTSGSWANGNYHYAYQSADGQIYDLVAQLEDPDNPNRCAVKQWRYHKGENTYPPDTIWCGPGPWSVYMYADH